MGYLKYVTSKAKIYRPDILLYRLGQIMLSGEFGNNGLFTEYLEAIFTQSFTSNKHAVAVTSATVGLELVINYLTQFKPRMRVAVPAFTFVATASAVKRFGHELVFVDSNLKFGIDENDLLTKHKENPIDLVIVPELFGNVADQDWGSIKKDYGIEVVFDRAHAIGMQEQNGLACVYSQHPTKALGAFELGVVTTDDPELDTYIRRARNFGFDPTSLEHANALFVGTNAKISEIASAAALTQLEYSDTILEHYKTIHKLYEYQINEINATGSERICRKNSKFSNYSYVCLASMNARELKNYLFAEGIDVKSYFRPINQYDAYKTDERFWMANMLYDTVLCLPTGLHIQPDDVKFICDIIKAFHEQ